jgi:hypothetical protein
VAIIQDTLILKMEGVIKMEEETTITQINSTHTATNMEIMDIRMEMVISMEMGIRMEITEDINNNNMENSTKFQLEDDIIIILVKNYI